MSEPQERMLAGIFGFTEFEPAAPANAADVDSGVFGILVLPAVVFIDCKKMSFPLHKTTEIVYN